MGSTRGKRSATAAGPSQTSNKRQRTTPNEDGAAFDADLLCDVLPPELLLLVVGNLSPRECQPLRLTCKSLRDLVNTAGAETLTVTNDIAQHLLLEQAKHCRTATHVLSSGWVARLLAKFPRIKKLDVKCSQSVLTMFARHMVRDCLGSTPPGAVPLSRIFDLAENVKTNSRRHSAVLLCELIKFKVAQSLTSKPPGYDAMRQDVKQYVRADQLLAEHRIELQTRVVELVEKVLTLKGHAEARAHENFKYARDTLDDSLLQLVSCLQPRHSKWLFYFLARQKQAEAAIEAYKVVDKQALAQLSPTCLSELFRSLIDNEITTQPEPKLRAITSESGSWTKFLYRGSFTLTSTQSREGALEKVAADLIGRDYLDTAVNVMNRFESEGTAMDIWVQLLGALGIVPGGEMPLVSRELHRSVTEQVTKAASLAMQAAPVRRVACHVPLVEVLVAEGHLDEAFAMVANYPEQGALDKHLLRALSNVLGLAECPPAHISSATCALLLDVLQNRLRDVAARSELTTILVAAHAARKELSKAVELASSLDDAAAAAMEADAGAAGGPAVEPVPAAAAAGPVAPGAPGPAGGAGAGADAGGGAGGEAGAEGAGGGPPEQRLAAMWRGVASAAIRLGDAGVLLTALPRVNTSWLMGPAETGHITAPGAGAGANGEGEDAVPMDVSWPAEPVVALGPLRGGGGAAAAAGVPASGGAAASPSSGARGGGLEAVPSTVWQRVCGVLLRAGKRPDLESALMQLLAERRRGLGGHTDQRALLESTARAMILNGCATEALALARRLGGGYPSVGSPGSASATASPVRGGLPAAFASYDAGGVRPCWSMLNVLLEGLLACGAVDTAVQELLAAGTAEAKAAAVATTPGRPAAGSSGSGVGSGGSLALLVMPAAAGRLRQSLLADVIMTLVESGRPSEAVCKAWPLGPSRDVQLDLLARRAMDKGRDLEVALQAGWLLGEASPQELRFAYTHRDLAQKCISQGMLEAAQSCLLRVKRTNWEDAGDATARELMRAVARTGDKTTALQLAASWLANDDHRLEFIKMLRTIRPPAAGGIGPGVGSRAGSSSRGSSRD
ncbi:hypothetical protein TSOC_002566 [Tetrabaena socialis]|uniref:F-box domain-containing protein n=1 Tax=Tetrabaena socialis TaxID=47790 RepID=A0A2J8ADT9_9CHLO|nr:hypothetical protein TSOC_002566 [Tetrabaena socialis]|eukprot:PNH10687.1 hypothetical protein TSOC_002566 [Tetrabaena socialis]